MKRTIWIILLCVVVSIAISPVMAQDDGLNLSTELYVLRNSGVVERYGLGAAGVEALTPDDVFVLDFAIAPDNLWMAYRTETGIFLTYMPEVRQSAPVLIEATGDLIPPVRGRGDTMAFSPQGDSLAYTTPYGARVVFNVNTQPDFFTVPNSTLLNLVWSPGGTHLAAEAENNIWWIYRRSGEEMLLTGALPTSFGTAWLDDWQLIFAPGEGGLLLLDLANANTQTTLQDSSREYSLPYVRPDGSIVVFSRPVDDPETAVTSGFLQRLTYADGVATVLETSETVVDLQEAHWTPGGQLLIALRQGLLGLVLPELGVHFVLPVSEPVAYSWGALYPPEVTGMILNYDGFFLAVDTITGIQQVWRLPVDGSPPILQTASETPVTAYAVSEFTQQIAYVTNDRLWTLLVNATGEVGEPVEIAEVDPTVADLEISPDGQQIAYADAAGIWSVAMDGGEPLLVIANGPTDQPGSNQPPFYSEPHYAPNVNMLLVRADGGETTQFVLFDPVSGELILLGQYDAAAWMVDGRLLAYGWGTGESAPTTDVYVVDPVDVPPSSYTVLSADASRVHHTRVHAPAQLEVVLSDNHPVGPSALRMVQVEITGGEPQPAGQLGYMVNPRVSPDGAFVAGVTQPGGRLLIYSVAQGSTGVLRAPGGVRDFQWVTFR